VAGAETIDPMLVGRGNFLVHLSRVTERRLVRFLLYVTLLAGFALRVRGLTFQSLWRDEVDALRFAVSGTVGSLSQVGWNGPLYTVALGQWVNMTGHSEFALRFPSVVFGTASLPLVFWLANCLFGRRGALAATCVVAFSPYCVWYSQEAKMYALLAFLGVASFALFWAAATRGSAWRWAAYVCVTAAIPYVHILGVLLIPAQAVAFLVNWRLLRRRWVPWLVSLGAMTLPYVPLATWQVPLLLSQFHTGHPFYPLPRMLAILWRGWTLGIVVSAEPWLSMPVALAVAAALWPSASWASRILRRLGRGREGRRAWSGIDSAPGCGGDADDGLQRQAVKLLLAWLLVPVALVYVISLRAPVFADRYLIASAVAFYVLVGWGIERIWVMDRFLGMLLLGVVLVVGLYGVEMQGSYSIKTDARGAADIVRESWQEGDVLVLQIPYLRHSVDYYLGDNYPSVEGPYTNYGMTPEELDENLATQLAGYGRAWLMLSEAAMWDERGLTLAWFRERTQLVAEWHLARLDLYLFSLSLLGPGDEVNAVSLGFLDSGVSASPS